MLLPRNLNVKGQDGLFSSFANGQKVMEILLGKSRANEELACYVPRRGMHSWKQLCDKNKNGEQIAIQLNILPVFRIP